VLVARVRALLRRAADPVPDAAGDLVVDRVRHRVRRGDTDIDLTARELAVLDLLVRRRGQVLSKREILDAVWDFDFDGDPNIVEVYVRRLRRKLDEPFGRKSIETVRGAGYRVVDDATA
jgi:DNA-binding response OmpR family regulator